MSQTRVITRLYCCSDGKRLPLSDQFENPILIGETNLSVPSETPHTVPPPGDGSRGLVQGAGSKDRFLAIGELSLSYA